MPLIQTFSNFQLLLLKFLKARYNQQSMRNHSYFPSPLRKDYLMHPLRNLPPRIPQLPSKPPSKPSTLASLPTNPSVSCKKFQDGLLVPLVVQRQKEAGIFLGPDCMCIIYQCLNNAPHQANYFVYPNGSVLSVDYSYGTINGWVIAVGSGFVAAELWKRGLRHGPKYYYDYHQQLLVLSQYSKGQLILISHGCTGQLEKLIQDHSLLERISSVKSRKFELAKGFPCIWKPNESISYYGTLLYNDEFPNGHGVLFSGEDIYIGHFLNGDLHGMGAIKFENGDQYFGQFTNGICSGYGKYTACSAGRGDSYWFDEEPVENIEFQRFLEMQKSSNNGIKWLEKYGDLQQFHKFYKNKATHFQSPDNIEDFQKSEVNLQLEDTESKKQMTSQEQEMNLQVRTTNLPNSKNVLVPKLSLFEQMKIKEKEKSREDTRNEIRSPQHLSIENKITQTERNERIKLSSSKNAQKVSGSVESSYLNPETIPNRRTLHRTLHNKGSQLHSNSLKFYQENPYEHIRTEQIQNDKWYVSSEHGFLRPKQMEPKGKIIRSEGEDVIRLDKSDGKAGINLGKLRKVDTQLEEGAEQQFMQRIGIFSVNGSHAN